MGDDIPHKVLKCPCPVCGLANDGATNMTGSGAPREGDYTVCIGCGEILVFNVIGAVDKMVKETFESLKEEHRMILLKLQEMVRKH